MLKEPPRPLSSFQARKTRRSQATRKKTRTVRTTLRPKPLLRTPLNRRSQLRLLTPPASSPTLLPPLLLSPRTKPTGTPSASTQRRATLLTWRKSRISRTLLILRLRTLFRTHTPTQPAVPDVLVVFRVSIYKTLPTARILKKDRTPLRYNRKSWLPSHPQHAKLLSSPPRHLPKLLNNLPRPPLLISHSA